ncbi:MAG: hypothetical protein EAX81_08675 [Candidatus Thorarchaeota archaeon]|nr:hypothetical protein [Candidatus Thorarchaeota archaeon]
MLYTRRLAKNELNTWLELEQPPTAEEIQFVSAFLNLPDSMFFITTVEGRAIGGTAIYRDKTRLAVALIAARLEAKLREDTALQLFRASLPFFKTLSIRDVDAIVGSDNTTGRIPFPMDFTLQSWTCPALKMMGFQKATHTYGIILEGNKSAQVRSPLKRDNTPNYDGARELLWNQRETIGLSCSQQWLAFDMAKARNTMATFHLQGKICLAIAAESFRGGHLVPFFAANPEILSSEMIAEAFLQHFSEGPLIFSLLGKGQKETINIIRNLCDSDSVIYEQMLLRKQL